MTPQTARPESQPTAQNMVTDLVDIGLTLSKIAQMLGKRVSSRTLYRWKNGKATPQRESDMDALKQVWKRCCD